MPRARFAAVLLPLTLTLAGCSSAPAPVADPRPATAAEPADSPALTTDPAGTVVPLDPDADADANAEGMVFDPVTGLLAVAVRNPNRLLLVDRNGGGARQVPLPGHARHLQLAAPGGPVLVPAEDSDTLVEVSLPDGGTQETPVGSYPHDAAQVAGGQVLVGDEKGGTLSVVEGGEVTSTLTSQTQPGGVAVVGDTAGVVDVGAFTLTTYDVPAGELLDVVDAGEGPTHLVIDARGRFLVVDTRGDAVLAFTADPLREVNRLRMPGTPYGLAHDGAAQVLWVTLTATNEVAACRRPATGSPRWLASPPSANPIPSPSTRSPGESSWAAGSPASCS
jgi:hypothetical protein